MLITKSKEPLQLESYYGIILILRQEFGSILAIALFPLNYLHFLLEKAHFKCAKDIQKTLLWKYNVNPYSDDEFILCDNHSLKIADKSL